MHVVATHAAFDDLTFTQDAGLQWYVSSHTAKRGFCAKCGSSIFYRMNGKSGIGIADGCLDITPGLRVVKHIFGASTGDDYPIPSDATTF